ncbi:response regulator [Alicyclobacillus suci]|uniref:response regulator n=1 Tax=Alicyclobacillus suci TaxID=2816080 RepID=UPI001A8EBEF9|nr:response regulator transcription factor [Alicyclobacillus suci]
MSQPSTKILVIDDEPQIRKMLRITLQAHGFSVGEAASGEDGIIQVSTARQDLVILDLGLPDIQGIEVLRHIREWSEVPVIVLTAKDREEDKILALESGADDYVTKPFGMGELVARIRVALRHGAKSKDDDGPVLTFGALVIDVARRTVELNGEKIKLTPIEYDLLKALAKNAGRVITHRQLFEQVWGGKFQESDSQYVRVHIGHLRKKLEKDPAKATLILTEPGMGYRFDDSVSP